MWQENAPLTSRPPLSSVRTGNKTRRERKINEWKARAGLGLSVPVQSACGRRCFASAQIECDLCQAQTLVSTVRLHGRKGSATAKPCPEMKAFSTAHNAHENNTCIV